MVFGLVRFIFIEKTVIVQLLPETAPQPELTLFIFYFYHDDEIQQLFLQASWAFLGQILSGSSFHNRLKAMHFCPRADILITDPPMCSSVCVCGRGGNVKSDQGDAIYFLDEGRPGPGRVKPFLRSGDERYAISVITGATFMHTGAGCDIFSYVITQTGSGQRLPKCTTSAC